MTRRRQLLVGAAVSVLVHGLALAALPGGGTRTVAAGASEGVRDEQAVVEVVSMLSAEEARALLEPCVLPAPPALETAPASLDVQDDATELGTEPPAARTTSSALAWTSHTIRPQVALSFAPLDEGRDPEDATRTLPEALTPRRRALAPDGREQGTQRAEDAGHQPMNAPPPLSGTGHLVLQRSLLRYPPAALRRGLEGRVAVGLEVSDAGDVVSTWILRSSGVPILDRAAERNIAAWRLDPGQLSSLTGRRFQQEVRFEIR